MAIDDKTRIIAYLAFSPPMGVVCDGDASVVAGSEDAMNGYLAKLGAAEKSSPIVRKIRFGEIFVGMFYGVTYKYRNFNPAMVFRNNKTPTPRNDCSSAT